MKRFGIKGNFCQITTVEELDLHADAFPITADLHVHAPWHAFRGMCKDWLNRYTFPEEENYLRGA